MISVSDKDALRQTSSCGFSIATRVIPIMYRNLVIDREYKRSKQELYMEEDYIGFLLSEFGGVVAL